MSAARGGSCGAVCRPVTRSGSCCAAPTTCSSCGGTRPPSHPQRQPPPEQQAGTARSSARTTSTALRRGLPKARQATGHLPRPPLSNGLTYPVNSSWARQDQAPAWLRQIDERHSTRSRRRSRPRLLGRLAGGEGRSAPRLPVTQSNAGRMPRGCYVASPKRSRPSWSTIRLPGRSMLPSWRGVPARSRRRRDR
jgi:hypothetical protein